MLATRYEQHCKDLPEFSLSEQQQLDEEACTRTLFLRLEVEWALAMPVAVAYGSERVFLQEDFVPANVY
jgi:hypothetical protein